MDKDDIEILLEVCDLYRTVTRLVGAENKLDSTNIEDTLLRLKDGEYIIKDNPDW